MKKVYEWKKNMRMKSKRIKKHSNEKSMGMKKKVNKWKAYAQKVYELKKVQNEKQSSNFFLTKPTRKSTQPNTKVVLSDDQM